MSVINKIMSILELDYDDDIPIKIGRDKPQRKHYNYPITEYEALSIAKKELTKAYIEDCSSSIITYVSLFLEVINVIKYNNNNYYYIKATGGDISGADNDTSWDREVTKEECKKLKCLVDVNNGKYIYIGNKRR